MSAAISCKNITFRYFDAGKPVLDNAGLEIDEGSITVIMGASGCGKSTLAAVICGLYPENGGCLDSGEISIFGNELSTLTTSRRAKYVSMMFQNPDLQFCMNTLREELVFCLENISCPKEEMDERIIKAAEKMEMADKLDRKLFTLSGGEKQRAMLCCILAIDAKCIFLDEPFANLDPLSIREIIPFFKKLVSDHGKTIVAIDHMSDHWLGTADRFILLGEGGRVAGAAKNEAELEAIKPVFRENGIAYPGIWEASGNMERSSACHEDKAALIEVKNYSLETSRKLYENADAVFEKGRITAVMGPSGAGKTSFFLSLLGQNKYQGDIIMHCGGGALNMNKMKAKVRFSHLGMAFQNPGNQFVSKNVLDEVAFTVKAKEKGISDETAKEKSLGLLDRCQLRKYQNFSPYMLSQGQQRRLAVIAVLAGGQELLLLDEPTYGQDYRNARALMDQVLTQVEERGLTVIMSTHDAGLVRSYADRIYYVDDKKFADITEKMREEAYI